MKCQIAFSASKITVGVKLFKLEKRQQETAVEKMSCVNRKNDRLAILWLRWILRHWSYSRAGSRCAHSTGGIPMAQLQGLAARVLLHGQVWRASASCSLIPSGWYIPGSGRSDGRQGCPWDGTRGVGNPAGTLQTPAGHLAPLQQRPMDIGAPGWSLERASIGSLGAWNRCRCRSPASLFSSICRVLGSFMAWVMWPNEPSPTTGLVHHNTSAHSPPRGRWELDLSSQWHVFCNVCFQSQGLCWLVDGCHQVLTSVKSGGQAIDGEAHSPGLSRLLRLALGTASWLQDTRRCFPCQSPNLVASWWTPPTPPTLCPILEKLKDELIATSTRGLWSWPTHCLLHLFWHFSIASWHLMQWRRNFRPTSLTFISLTVSSKGFFCCFWNCKKLPSLSFYPSLFINVA